MGKPKEDRSGWVAVAPEFEPKIENEIRPATSAYQFFQRETTEQVKEELVQQNSGTFDVGQFSRAMRDKWASCDSDRKVHFEDLARADAFRFGQESHQADVLAMQRQDRLRQEREELILYDHQDGGDGGKRSTRRGRKKQLKKKERSERKQQHKQKKEKKNTKTKTHHDGSSLSDPEFREDSDADASFGDDSSSSSSSSSSSFDSDDSDRPQKPKKPPPKVSQAVLERREKARNEKEEKETYIAERQEELRTDRASQAKRRLDFLLKQSDIFSHFGAVKEDQTKLTTRSTTTTTTQTHNTATSQIEDAGESRRHQSVQATSATEAERIDVAALEDADEHDATFLTTQPSTLGFGKMRNYQLEGLNWMIRLQEHGVNGILADEMGLGKTLQSISVLVYMMEHQESNGPHLIVVPKSTLSNWMNELKRWAPEITAVKFHGTKDEREELSNDVLQPGQRDEHRSWNVVVTTYEVCNIEKNVLNKFAWSYLIIDEAHRLKNEASAFSRTIRTFETRYRLLLTGTPLQNNLHELWALLNFLVPDVFASAEQFDEWFNLDIDDADEKNKLISQLHKVLRPFMLRRLKVDVEKSLPPKHETILYTGMSAVQKKLYKDILLRDVDLLQGQGGGNRTAILNIVMQLRKCAGHPYLFPGLEDRTLPALGEHLVNNCGKMVLLDKLLRRLKERGHRVLLFTQMTRILDILEDYMVMRHFKYCRIDGNTTYDVRENYIDAFNAPGSEKFLFLLSTRAGGLGINLQTADIVILYDSDWNPQADLQAQDRAHRIGQKRQVQVFRLVTEHTIEEKVVERAQQKLKLDAMVVQSGRLKDKDKVSRDELLAAVRFGADKVFKSKDSSITDDDIDLILDAGKRKTQELNEKLQNADKGDMLDFKLDGSISTQTYEGVDYSGEALAQAKAAQAQAELLGILDIGKRERRTVANYNENQLYQQQMNALQGGIVKERKKKVKRLPKFLRLTRMEEWQMFDRATLKTLQEEEEKAFKSLPEEQQKLAYAKDGHKLETAEQETADEEKTTSSVDEVEVLPPLLNEEQELKKKSLQAEGFAEWGRHHYTAFLKASARFGRANLIKISKEVGKPQSSVEEYAAAFWSETMGKMRFSEHEYDRVVKLIERGEKKIDETRGLERGTGVLISLFEHPWVELEFRHVNCKDKMFTMDEDRHLLCWAHKFGYGQWGAVKMAIRRSPNFRFDYFLRSLPTDMIGRRCEQLMKAAKGEVEQLEKKDREDAGLTTTEEEKKDDIHNATNSKMCEENKDNEIKPDQLLDSELPPVELPMYKAAQTQRRIEEQKGAELKKKDLETKVEEIEEQMRTMQDKLKGLQEYNRDANVRNPAISTEFPDELIPNLANLLAMSGPAGVMTIANQFSSEYPGRASKRKTIFKIEQIAKKEKRDDEGDTKPVWYILPDYENMLDVDTLRHLRKMKEERHQKLEEKHVEQSIKETSDEDDQDRGEQNGAVGPDGTFVLFPEYTGTEPPKESKKAFTHFCMATRRDVKKTLDPSRRKDKQKVNFMLKDRWFSLEEDETKIWKSWEKWDAKRFAHDSEVFEQAIKKRKKSDDVLEDHGQSAALQGMHIPKKRKS